MVMSRWALACYMELPCPYLCWARLMRGAADGFDLCEVIHTSIIFHSMYFQTTCTPPESIVITLSKSGKTTSAQSVAALKSMDVHQCFGFPDISCDGRFLAMGCMLKPPSEFEGGWTDFEIKMAGCLCVWDRLQDGSISESPTATIEGTGGGASGSAAYTYRWSGWRTISGGGNAGPPLQKRWSTHCILHQMTSSR